MIVDGKIYDNLKDFSRTSCAYNHFCTAKDIIDSVNDQIHPDAYLDSEEIDQTWTEMDDEIDYVYGCEVDVYNAVGEKIAYIDMGSENFGVIPYNSNLKPIYHFGICRWNYSPDEAVDLIVSELYELLCN